MNVSIVFFIFNPFGCLWLIKLFSVCYLFFSPLKWTKIDSHTKSTHLGRAGKTIFTLFEFKKFLICHSLKSKHYRNSGRKQWDYLLFFLIGLVVNIENEHELCNLQFYNTGSSRESGQWTCFKKIIFK